MHKVVTDLRPVKVTVGADGKKREEALPAPRVSKDTVALKFGLGTELNSDSLSIVEVLGDYVSPTDQKLELYCNVTKGESIRSQHRLVFDPRIANLAGAGSGGDVYKSLWDALDMPDSYIRTEAWRCLQAFKKPLTRWVLGLFWSSRKGL